MKIQKSKLLLIACLAFVVNVYLANNTLAGASATLSWTPPTTDEGGGALTGLTGYKIFYHTSSLWASVTGTCAQGVGSVVNVSGGATNKHIFLNNLTPGSTYYFTVAATDGINLSGCGVAQGSTATQVSKRLTYSSDFNNTQSVNIFDYNLLKGAFGTSQPTTGDSDRDNDVDIFDYNILKADYGLSFI